MVGAVSLWLCCVTAHIRIRVAVTDTIAQVFTIIIIELDRHLDPFHIVITRALRLFIKILNTTT